MKFEVMVRVLIAALLLSQMLACSWFPTFDEVVPDRNKEYLKSGSLPDLEIPPDLSADAISDTLSVPDVDAKGSASYSTYQERIARRGESERSARDSDGGAYREPVQEIDTTEEPVENREVPARDEEEQAVAAEEPSDDEGNEVGVSEDTAASAPTEEVDRKTSETDAEPASASEDDAAAEAAEDEPAVASERAAADVTDIGRQGAAGLVELVSAGEGKKYLRITEDFSKAWDLTGAALAKAGLTVEDEDQDRGVYFLDFAGSAGTAPEQSGFWSSLWSGDRNERELQLTGIGAKTEVVVLDADGNWEGSPVADEILTRLETALNQAGH